MKKTNFVCCFVINLPIIQDNKEKYCIFLLLFHLSGIFCFGSEFNNISRMERTLLLHVHVGCHNLYINLKRCHLWGKTCDILVCIKENIYIIQ